MNDEGVDELLKDLDAALSVEPSPSVAARVRTRIDQQAGRAPVGWRVAMGLGVAMVLAFALWPREDSTRPNAAGQAIGVTASREVASAIVSPSPTRTEIAHQASVPALAGRAHRRTAEVRLVRPREPEVIVSPEIRLAFEQLQAAARTGRVTAESFTFSQPELEPMIVVPDRIEVRPVEIDTTPVGPEATSPSPDGAGQSSGQTGPIWLRGPLSRTRSSS